MKFSETFKLVVLFGALLLGLVAPGANAATVIAGLDPLSDNGGADGWSGITVLETPIVDAGDGVTTGRVTKFNFHTDEDRAGQIGLMEHHVTPLLIEYDGLDYKIVGIGTARTPAESGEFSFEFGLVDGTDEVDTSSPNSFHIGVLQLRDGVDDVTGGAIPFAGTDGEGMFQMNVPGPDYTPVLDTLVTAGHSSAAGGRLYAFNFEIEYGDAVDTDEDGMTDEWEDLHALDKNDPDDAAEDPDLDLSPNLEEFNRRTDPRDSDSDDDTLLDGIESNSGTFVDSATDTGTDPKNPDSDNDGLGDEVETNSGTYVDAMDTGTDPNNSDSDGDTLLDGVENNTLTFVDAAMTGTNPHLVDTDGDSYDDGVEIQFGFNPTDANSKPVGSIAGQQTVIERTNTDTWTHLLYVDEARVFILQGPASANEFNFFASNDTGVITPLVFEITAPDTFIVRAIGTTRSGGIDWTGVGPQSFPFSDEAAPTIQDGWAAGFMTYNLDGTVGGSPIPFDASNIDGWLTGSADGTAPALVTLNEAPPEGGSGVSADAFGARDYAFQIVAGPAGPPFAITSIVLDDPTDPSNGDITITWNSKPGQTYGLFFSTDMVNFDSDIDDGIASQGDTTSASFSLPIPDAKRIFFRVEQASGN